MTKSKAVLTAPVDAILPGLRKVFFLSAPHSVRPRRVIFPSSPPEFMKSDIHGARMWRGFARYVDAVEPDLKTRIKIDQLIKYTRLIDDIVFRLPQFVAEMRSQEIRVRKFSYSDRSSHELDLGVLKKIEETIQIATLQINGKRKLALEIHRNFSPIDTEDKCHYALKELLLVVLSLGAKRILMSI